MPVKATVQNNEVVSEGLPRALAPVNPMIRPVRKEFEIGDDTLKIPIMVKAELDNAAGMNFMRRVFADWLRTKGAAIRDSDQMRIEVLYSSDVSVESSEWVAVKLRVKGSSEFVG